MKTITWTIDGKVGKNHIADEIMYNDSGNELVNISEFVEGFMNVLGEYIDDRSTWMEMALSAYVTGAVKASGHWGELEIERTD